MSRRRLSDDERALWRGITRAIAPLRKKASAAEHENESVPAESRTKPRPEPAPISAAPQTSIPAPLAVVPLGRRARKQIAKGRRSIDARLDLHGMTQAEAHDALLRFLRTAQARDARLVLVITGKGGRSGFGGGVLKRMVPLWLALPEFRALVTGFDAAGVGHGGEGALYVTVRRTNA